MEQTCHEQAPGLEARGKETDSIRAFIEERLTTQRSNLRSRHDNGIPLREFFPSKRINFGHILFYGL